MYTAVDYCCVQVFQNTVLSVLQVEHVPSATSSKPGTPPLSPHEITIHVSSSPPQPGQSSSGQKQCDSRSSIPPDDQVSQVETTSEAIISLDDHVSSLASETIPNVSNPSWWTDIFATDRLESQSHTIHQKTSESSVKPEYDGNNSIFSLFPPLWQNSAGEGSTLRCGDASENNSHWSNAVDLSLTTSKWEQAQMDDTGKSSSQHQGDQTGTDFIGALESSSSWWMPAISEDVSSCQQQREHYPRETLSEALNFSFNSSRYSANPIFSNFQPMLQQQDYQYSDEVFQQESGLLQHMNMLVPLASSEVATYSKGSTFKYTALHNQDSSLDDIQIPQLRSPQLKDLNDSSIPDHVRKGVNYNEGEIIDVKPEVRTCIVEII